MTDAPWLQDTVSLVDAFRSGDRSPVEEVEATLAAIDASELNAFTYVDAATRIGTKVYLFNQGNYARYDVPTGVIDQQPKPIVGNGAAKPLIAQPQKTFIENDNSKPIVEVSNAPARPVVV